MNLPEPTETRAHPAKAKREDVWPELAADIAALSTLDEWNTFWPVGKARMEALPLGWEDVFYDAMQAQLDHLLEWT